MKKDKIIFWLATGIIFLFEGVMPAFTINMEAAKAGMQHLGYPEYFRNMLVACKIFGALALVVPQVPGRVKEWAYAGFTFNFIFAFLSHWAVDGLSLKSCFPLLILAILLVSYRYCQKINDQRPVSAT